MRFLCSLGSPLHTREVAGSKPAAPIGPAQPVPDSEQARSRGSRSVPKPLPTATIFPSPWIATPVAPSLPPKLVVCLPSPEKSGRATRTGCSGRARSRCRGPCRPTATILPFAWIATPSPRRSPRSRSSACRPRRSSCRASRWGCSGRGRSRRRPPLAPTTTILPSSGAQPRRRGRRGRRSRSSACRRREARVERAVRVVAGEGEIGRLAAAPAPDSDDLAVAPGRHPARLVGAAEVGRLLAVAGEARVERAVGVVAGEREVVAAGPPARRHDDLAVGLDRHAVRRVDAPRSRSSACRRRRSWCRASRRVVAGEGEVAAVGASPDHDDLAVGLDATPGRRRRRSRSSACRRRRSWCRACRRRCSGRGRSRASRRVGRRPRRSCRRPGAPRHGRRRRRRSRSSACRRRRSWCRAMPSGL